MMSGKDLHVASVKDTVRTNTVSEKGEKREIDPCGN